MSTLLDVVKDNPAEQRRRTLELLEEKLKEVCNDNSCVLSIINNVYNPQARPYSMLEITTIGIVEQMLVKQKESGCSTLFIILNTLGGDIHFPEMLITKIRGLEFNRLYVIVPGIAMSAGSLLVLLSDGLWAPRRAVLGPIDPQLVLQTPQGPRVVPAISLKKLIEETIPRLAIEKELGKENLTKLYIAQDLLAYQAALQSLKYMSRILEREVKKRLRPEAYEKLKKSFLSDVSTHGKPLNPQFLKELGFPVTILDEDVNHDVLKLIERYDALCQKSFLFEPGLKTLMVGSRLVEIVLGVRPPQQPPQPSSKPAKQQKPEK